MKSRNLWVLSGFLCFVLFIWLVWFLIGGCGSTVNEATTSTTVFSSTTTSTTIKSIPIASGTLDTSFGVNGLMVKSADGYSTNVFGNSIAIESSGRLIVSGSDAAGPETWGFTASGTTDAGFGSGGLVDFGRYMILDSSGKIVIARAIVNEIQVRRYDRDGDLDPTFGINGATSESFDVSQIGGYPGDETPISSDGTGRILVAGYSGGSVFVTRFNSDGSLDKTFTDGTHEGFVVYKSSIGNDSDYTAAIACAASGKIFVTGKCMSYNSISGRSDYYMFIVAIKENGQIDEAGFGTNGWVLADNYVGTKNGEDWGNAIAVDSSGRILVAGQDTDNSLSERMILWRYNSDGTLDESFTDGDTTGYVVYNKNTSGVLLPWQALGNAIAFDAAGNIVVAGAGTPAIPGIEDILYTAVWRYDPSGAIDKSFGSDGVVYHNGATGPGSDDRGIAMAIYASGNILVLGSSKPVGSAFSAMVVLKYK